MSMAALVKEVFELNQQFFQYDPSGEVQPPGGSEHYLGAPSSEDTLQAFEQSIALRLPPSYRSFLLLHDGWTGWSGPLNLLSVAQMSDENGPYADWIESEVKAEAREYGHDAVVHGLVIGSALFSANCVVLDTTDVDDHAEMPVISWEHVEIARHRNFHHFLSSRIGLLQRLIHKHEARCQT